MHYTTCHSGPATPLMCNSSPFCSRADTLCNLCLTSCKTQIRFKWIQIGLGFSCPKKHKRRSREVQANNTVFPGAFSEDSHPENVYQPQASHSIIQPPTPLKTSPNLNQHLFQLRNLSWLWFIFSGSHPTSLYLGQNCCFLQLSPDLMAIFRDWWLMFKSNNIYIPRKEICSLRNKDKTPRMKTQ